MLSGDISLRFVGHCGRAGSLLVLVAFYGVFLQILIEKRTSSYNFIIMLNVKCIKTLLLFTKCNTKYADTKRETSNNSS